MAKREQLREIHAGMILNMSSKKQESDLGQALEGAIDHLNKRFGNTVVLRHYSTWILADIVDELREVWSGVESHCHFNNTSIKPDGGILCVDSAEEGHFLFPILIAEAKRQGTNVDRVQEGLSKQAKGNAIERLGKNLIGLRTALLRESIFPFVCFGYGCDFAPDSSILDRVSTMAMFGRLNKTYLHNEGDGRFDRGSFYFREEKWSIAEMREVMIDIAERSVLYYFSKYGEERFRPREAGPP